MVLYERLSWEESCSLAGRHDGDVDAVAFSPNGTDRLVGDIAFWVTLLCLQIHRLQIHPLCSMETSLSCVCILNQRSMIQVT